MTFFYVFVMLLWQFFFKFWKSQVNDVFCKHDVIRPVPKNAYLGLADGEWKESLCNHELFKHKRYSSETAFSSYVALENVSSEYLTWSRLFWDAHYHT